MSRVPPAGALPPEALRRACAPESFAFETTADLPALEEVLGQPRAVAALEFGASIASHGFNLFALGSPGSGKTTLVKEYLERRAAKQPVPPDLCYVNNFGDAHRPLALRLPPGRAVRLQRDMDALVTELREAIPKAFDTKEYATHRDKIGGDLQRDALAESARLEARVTKFGFQLTKGSGGGLMLVPALEGRRLSDHELEELSPEQREKLSKIRDGLGEEVEEGLRHLRELERGARDALHALETETALNATRHIVDELRAGYRDLPAVQTYLDAVQADVVEHAEDFRGRRDEEKSTLPAAAPLPTENPFTRYIVNPVVDNGGLAGAPVVVESNPTYHNLVGRIEHRSVWGAVSTDFTMIKPGALQRANGGYLVIPARECLLNPYAWDGLKRALKDRAVRIEELGAQLSVVSTVTLDPEPVPLDVKVVLIGSPMLYYLLYGYDEDFQKLFKVKAEFTTQMERTAESERAYALFVSTIVKQDRGLPFDRGAVAQVVEFGARLAGDQDKLATRFGEIADLIREAGHRAAQGGQAAVTAEDVRTAVAARRFRQNLVEEHMQEAVAEGTLLIDTRGVALGRINGLSVLSMGDYAFGHPSRITATVAPGRGGVVSIEREVKLSGPIHGKGVLILSGYINQRYAQASPLSLSASLVFEQSYGMVEGDSATLAELYALLSMLAGIPLRQDIAVTGSVNQHGQVQPVGGVIEKIEGFFDICRARGLTGKQGVLIPAANRRHLMLREDVVQAVRAGEFNVWTAADADDGISLLMNVDAGEPDRQGVYPAGTLHRNVAERLATFAKILKAAGAADAKPKGEEKGPPADAQPPDGKEVPDGHSETCGTG
ncbi:MAG: Lon protease family protein [Acidobacteriota bacterium]